MLATQLTSLASTGATNKSRTFYELYFSPVETPLIEIISLSSSHLGSDRIVSGTGFDLVTAILRYTFSFRPCPNANFKHRVSSFEALLRVMIPKKTRTLLCQQPIPGVTKFELAKKKSWSFKVRVLIKFRSRPYNRHLASDTATPRTLIMNYLPITL